MDNLVIYRFKSSTGQIGAVATVVTFHAAVLLRWAWYPGTAAPRQGALGPDRWRSEDGEEAHGGEPGSDVSDALR